MALFNTIFKLAGTIKPTQENDEPLHKVVLEAYLLALYKNNQMLEVFLEQRRSRSGRIQPIESSDLMEIIVKNYLRSPGNKKEVVFVPVTINYDRVIDGEVFPLDLLGEKPIKESFSTILKHLKNTRKKLGKVVV